MSPAQLPLVTILEDDFSSNRIPGSPKLDKFDPTTTRHAMASVMEPRSLRTSTKRVYHRTSSSSLLHTSPNSAQPFLYFDQDPHLVPCIYHRDLKFPNISTIPFSSIAGISDSKPFWLALYFVFNLGLTLYNKDVLLRFPFPYTLTALHALSGTIGGYFMLSSGAFRPARLSAMQSMVLAAFSLLYAVNIAVSNVSLQLVTVPFHQVVRGSTPIFTIGLSSLLFGHHCSSMKLVSLVPVIVGVGFATYGDYYYSYWGFLLTTFGTFLAALKTILTHVLQSPSSLSHADAATCAVSAKPQPRLIPPLHPLDLLMRMSPLAFVQCVLYAHLSGELTHVRAYALREMTHGKALALACNGAIAFGLNVVSFTANMRVGALSMTVAANVKQVMTILFAVTIFDLTITGTNAMGILLTLLGGAWYAVVEYREKRESKTGCALS